jgi:KDO2-lipid IV(A) lauroyltransferase
MVESGGQRAVGAIRQLLEQNGIIMLDSIDVSDNSVKLPFFDGQVEVAAEPPRLAQATGAALLPAFSARDAAGDFQLFIHPPLDVMAGQARVSSRLLQDYIACLEAHLLRHPTAWPDWRRNVAARGRASP